MKKPSGQVDKYPFFTKKKKKFSIPVSDDNLKKLQIEASLKGLSVEELIVTWIKELVDSVHGLKERVHKAKIKRNIDKNPN